MKRFKVGQVWKMGDEFVMVSTTSKGRVTFGKAMEVGSSYRMVGTPTTLGKKELRSLTFVFDTEA